MADIGAGESAGFDESDEVLDEVLEENIVFPEGVVGVDEESVASHSRSYFSRGYLQGLGHPFSLTRYAGTEAGASLEN